MLDRKTLSSLAIAGLFLSGSVAHCLAEQPVPPAAHADEDGDKAKHHDKKHEEEKDGEKDGDKKEWKEEKEKDIEQAVPMNFVPTAVLDAVKKEVPGGNITEAELVAQKGKIMYAFDVTAGDTKYDVKITVDGKFYSKKVEDEKAEKDEKGESEMKPAPAEKK